jgi:hypothetical protein
MVMMVVMVLRGEAYVHLCPPRVIWGVGCMAGYSISTPCKLTLSTVDDDGRGIQVGRRLWGRTSVRVICSLRGGASPFVLLPPPPLVEFASVSCYNLANYGTSSYGVGLEVGFDLVLEAFIPFFAWMYVEPGVLW